MTKRLTISAIKKRLATGETAASIDIETYTKQLEIVQVHDFTCRAQLIRYLTDNRMRDTCASCIAAHDDCGNCLLPIVDNGLCCEDEGSVFDKYWLSETREELELNILELIEKLKQCDQMEKEV